LLLIFPMICVRLWRLFSLLWSLRNDVIKEKDTFQRYLHTIRLETKRLSGLIDDLFQFSQLESGTETFSPELYHLDNLIIEVLQSFQLQLEESKIEGIRQYSGKNPTSCCHAWKNKKGFHKSNSECYSWVG